MKKEEVTKWLTIMKANLNSFPEINCGKKTEALAEAIRLLKNEQSKEPSSSEKPNTQPEQEEKPKNGKSTARQKAARTKVGNTK